MIDVIGIVAAMGFAAEVSHCLYLCGETWRKGDKGATNDMIARSLERQCGASAARAAKRGEYESTQLIRAERDNYLPCVLQLVRLGTPREYHRRSCCAPLEIWDRYGNSALNYAAILPALHI